MRRVNGITELEVDAVERLRATPTTGRLSPN